MNNIKVRFAPSPTGYMHIGNTRTAVFNWLLARKLGGKFMLRIDDTDVLRSKKEYEDSLRDVLQWMGLVWSEEARQSARMERYNEVVEKLKSEGIEPENCTDSQLMLLTQPEERELIRHLASLTGEIVTAAKNYDPARITRYVVELATLFHKFYNSCKVNCGDNDLTQARLYLCACVRDTLRNVLEMLKITVPESM